MSAGRTPGRGGRLWRARGPSGEFCITRLGPWRSDMCPVQCCTQVTVDLWSEGDPCHLLHCLLNIVMILVLLIMIVLIGMSDWLS